MDIRIKAPIYDESLSFLDEKFKEVLLGFGPAGIDFFCVIIETSVKSFNDRISDITTETIKKSKLNDLINKTAIEALQIALQVIINPPNDEAKKLGVALVKQLESIGLNLSKQEDFKTFSGIIIEGTYNLLNRLIDKQCMIIVK